MIRRFAAARHENARAVRGARHTNEARAMPPNKVDARRFGADRANVTRASSTLASTKPSAGARCVDHTAELVDRAGKGDENDVQRLLMLRVDPDARLRGEHAICAAASGGHAGCVQLLLRAGADPLAHDNVRETALHRACRVGHRDTVRAILSDSSVSPDTRAALLSAETHVGLTPAHVAAENGHADVCAALTAAGAPLEAVDAYGATPLVLAVKWGRVDAAAALLDAGADAGEADPEHADDGENDHGSNPTAGRLSALTVAARAGHARMEATLWRVVAERARRDAQRARRDVSVLSDFGEVRDALAAEVEAEKSARLTAQNAALAAAAMVEAKTREAERAAAEARAADEAREAALAASSAERAELATLRRILARERASAKALEEAKYVAEARAEEERRAAATHHETAAAKEAAAEGRVAEAETRARRATEAKRATEETLRTTREALAAARGLAKTEMAAAAEARERLRTHREAAALLEKAARMIRGEVSGRERERGDDDDGDVGDDGDDDATSIRTVR